MPVYGGSGPLNLVVGVSPFAVQAALGLSANFGWFAAFQVLRPATATNAAFQVTTQNGNLDLGIYQDDGAGNLTRIASTGSFACPAAGYASRALTAPVALVPGVRYYAAIATDSASAAVYAGATGGGLGSGARMSCYIPSSFPLPASRTFDAVVAHSLYPSVFFL